MITLKEIRRAVNEVLKKAYPEVEIYGTDTVEGYTKPSFFVYITQTFSEATKNARHKNVEVEIDYIQEAPNESDAMDFFEKAERSFLHRMKVGDRMLHTSDFFSDFQGANRNIPCLRFNLEFWDSIERVTDNTPMMGEVNVRQGVKRWDYQ